MVSRMKKRLILISLGFLTGCAVTPPPMSVEELRAEVRSNPSRIQVEEYEVERPFLPAFNAVQTNAERCFEVTLSKIQENTPDARPESLRYRAESFMTSETEGETFLQLDKKAAQRMPEGGYYVLLADIEAISAKKTRVTVYRAMRGYDTVNESIVAWAQGKSDHCPKFPKDAQDWRLTNHNP